MSIYDQFLQLNHDLGKKIVLEELYMLHAENTMASISHLSHLLQLSYRRTYKFHRKDSLLWIT